MNFLKRLTILIGFVCWTHLTAYCAEEVVLGDLKLVADQIFEDREDEKVTRIIGVKNVRVDCGEISVTADFVDVDPVKKVLELRGKVVVLTKGDRVEALKGADIRQSKVVWHYKDDKFKALRVHRLIFPDE